MDLMLAQTFYLFFTQILQMPPQDLKNYPKRPIKQIYFSYFFFSSPRLVKRLGEHKDYAWVHDRAYLLFLHTSLHLDARTCLCLGEKKSKRL